MGWCDDPKSKIIINLLNILSVLNRKLYRKDNIYDIILVLNYNMNPIKKKRQCNFYSCCKKKFKTPKDV